MNKLKTLIILTLIALTSTAFSPSAKTGKYDYLVTITTDYGVMKLILFDDTPIHKANFIKLAESGKYNGSIFHRVIKNFMIQGGAMKAEEIASMDTLSFEDKTLPNEIMDKHKHIFGALAAARVENPQKRSDLSQFYIVQNHSGSHFLDNNYTVFGQLLIGFDVLDKIVDQDLNGSAPIKPIEMQVTVEKVKRTDMVKFYGDIYTMNGMGVE